MFDPRNSADHVYKESGHSDFFVQEAQYLGSRAPARVLYVASKVLAERTIWQYMKEFQVWLSLVRLGLLIRSF